MKYYISIDNTTWLLVNYSQLDFYKKNNPGLVIVEESSFERHRKDAAMAKEE